MSTINELAARAANLKREIGELENRTTSLNKQLGAVNAQLLDAMVEADLRMVMTDDGVKIETTQYVNGKIIDAETLHAHLKAIGEDGMCKMSIHPSTFKKWISDHADPADPATWPPGVEITAYPTVKIKLPRNEKATATDDNSPSDINF